MTRRESLGSLRDPFVASAVVLALLVVGGLASIWVAWRNSARLTVVGSQLPILVSAGLGGLGLLVFAAGIASIQHRRHAEAIEADDFDAAINAARQLLERRRSRLGGD